MNIIVTDPMYKNSLNKTLEQSQGTTPNDSSNNLNTKKSPIHLEYAPDHTEAYFYDTPQFRKDFDTYWENKHVKSKLVDAETALDPQHINARIERVMYGRPLSVLAQNPNDPLIFEEREPDGVNEVSTVIFRVLKRSFLNLYSNIDNLLFKMGHDPFQGDMSITDRELASAVSLQNRTEISFVKTQFWLLQAELINSIVYPVFLFGLILFFIGLWGVLSNQKYIITILMATEIMFFGLMLLFMGTAFFWTNGEGLIFSLGLLALAGVESAIGLALLVSFFATQKTILYSKLKSLDS